MPPKEKRLNSLEIKDILKNGIRRKVDIFSILVLKQPKIGYSVVVSNKNSKNSVDRNHIRRKVYGILNKVKGNISMVVVVNEAPKSESYVKLEKYLEEL